MKTLLLAALLASAPAVAHNNVPHGQGLPHRVRAALNADKATLNRTAETAWGEFDTTWNANLTPVQRAHRRDERAWRRP